MRKMAPTVRESKGLAARMQEPKPGGRVRAPWASAALLFIGLLVVGGCSSVPDEANPIEWYRGVEGWVTGDEPRPSLQPVPGANQPYPNLASVPSAPTGVPDVRARTEVAEGLVADRANALYADERVRRGLTPPGAAPRGAVTGGANLPPPPGPAPEYGAFPEPPPEYGGFDNRPPPPPPPSPPSFPVTQAMPARAPASVAQTGAGNSILAQVYQRSLAASERVMTNEPTGPRSNRPAPNLFGTPPPAAFAASSALPTASKGVLPSPAPAPAVSSAPPLRVARAANPEARPYRGLNADSAAVSHHVATILFATGSNALSREAKSLLGEIADWQRSNGGIIRIVGYASSRTRDMDAMRHRVANFRISLERAEAVARELRRHGVAPGKLAIGAKSDTEPVFSEAMPSGEAANRRAEVYIDL
jgi:outer membrane protein OmpA-like peptidoglycan-associated protein